MIEEAIKTLLSTAGPAGAVAVLMGVYIIWREKYWTKRYDEREGAHEKALKDKDDERAKAEDRCREDLATANSALNTLQNNRVLEQREIMTQMHEVLEASIQSDQALVR